MKKGLIMALLVLAGAWFIFANMGLRIEEDEMLQIDDDFEITGDTLLDETSEEDQFNNENELNEEEFIFNDSMDNEDVDISDTTNETSDIQNKLVSNVWIWEKTVMNNDDTFAPNNFGDFSLTFNEDWSVFGETDCNNFFGPYQLDGLSIEMGPLASTLMYCEGSQEQEFMSMISEVNLVFFDENDNLVLQYPFDSGSVMFVAQQNI